MKPRNEDGSFLLHLETVLMRVMKVIVVVVYERSLSHIQYK